MPAASAGTGKGNDKPKRYSVHVRDIQVRDPFIFADTLSGNYYLHYNDSYKISCYESRDLVHWRYCGRSFVPGKGFWGRSDFWAPDLFRYRGRYYLFVTFSSPEGLRGTSILVSDRAEGPFEPLVNGPVTPPDQMCLDGTLYLDEGGNPWLLYCHEWIEVGDGEIWAVRLSEDLAATEGEPMLLFKASEAPWTGTLTYRKVSPEVVGRVTDAPFIHRLDDGRLVMLWSSFERGTGKYAIGQAVSENGIEGPWMQSEHPVNSDNGGHAMLFPDLEGDLRISYHAPNNSPSYPVIRTVRFDGTKLLFE